MIIVKIMEKMRKKGDLILIEELFDYYSIIHSQKKDN
jgi:hypothetical protein